MRAAIVLAAGASRRFGRGDKALAPLDGRPLILHAVACAREAGCARVLIVIDPRRARLARVVRGEGVIVRAAAARAGLGASLAAGLAALRPIEREALIFLGDMPCARAPRRLRLAAGIALVRPIVAGMPGHPVLVRSAAARRARPGGDRGLRLGPVATVRGRAGNLADVDTRAALRHLRLAGSYRCAPAFRR